MTITPRIRRLPPVAGKLQLGLGSIPGLTLDAPRTGRTPLSGDSHILILNYNGADLLAECLPSVVEAARQAPNHCRVSIIDNESTDDSLAYLERAWPEVGVISALNRGLASFNAVARDLTEPVLLLLNNDVKLEPDAIKPLVAALQTNQDALFTAPRCWTFDGLAYEGMRTRVRSRFGLIQGLCRYPGFEAWVNDPDLTASSGPILAVDRGRFLALGGYDPVYFPGRIEDLDLGFRGWMAGWRGYYVPESVAYHKGFGSFGPAFGAAGCDQLATRKHLDFRLEEPGRGTPLRASGLAPGPDRLRRRFGSVRIHPRPSRSDWDDSARSGRPSPLVGRARGLGRAARGVFSALRVRLRDQRLISGSGGPWAAKRREACCHDSSEDAKPGDRRPTTRSRRTPGS